MSDLETGKGPLSADLRKRLLTTATRLEEYSGDTRSFEVPRRPIPARLVLAAGEAAWVAAWNDGRVEYLDRSLDLVGEALFSPSFGAATNDGTHVALVDHEFVLWWDLSGPQRTSPHGLGEVPVATRSALRPDGSAIAFVLDRTVHLLTPESALTWLTPEDHVDTPPWVVGWADGDVIVCAGAVLLRFSPVEDPAGAGTEHRRIGSWNAEIVSAAVSTDEQSIALIDETGEWWRVGLLWDFEDIEMLRDECEKNSRMSADGHLIVEPLIGELGRVVGWRGDGNEGFSTSRWQPSWRVAVSPAGVMLGSASGLELHGPAGRARRISRVGGRFGPFSDDGRRIAFATTASTLVLDDRGRCLHDVPSVRSVRTIANSGEVLTCSAEVWRFRGDAWRSEEPPAEGRVNSVWCTPNGAAILVGFTTDYGPVIAARETDDLQSLRWQVELNAPIKTRALYIGDDYLVLGVGSGFCAIDVQNGAIVHQTPVDDPFGSHHRAEPDVITSTRGQRFRRVHLTGDRQEEGDLPFDTSEQLDAVNWRDRWYVIGQDSTAWELAEGRARRLGRSDNRPFVCSDGRVVLVDGPAVRISQRNASVTRLSGERG